MKPDADPGAQLSAQRLTLPGFDTQIGPLGHLAAERHRLDGLSWDHFEVTRCGATIGAELAGIDLGSEFPAPVMADIVAALAEYKVIFFRDQSLTSERHVEVARSFGDLEIHPFIPSNTGIDELVRFEKGADVGGYENGWHHDVTWRATPSKAAVLRAVSVPDTGGDTLFSDAYAAYDGLDDATKELIADMTMVHDFRLAFGHTLGDDDDRRDENPPVEHPVAPVHDVTGRRYLYVNRYFTSHIAGKTREDSLRLINELASSFEIPEYQCRFHWEPNSVAIWDNRAVQHYAASDYWPDVRIMERASIVGAAPRS